MCQMKRSSYRSYLKYYRAMHQHQAAQYAQMAQILEHLRGQCASQSAVLSRALRTGLSKAVTRLASVNHFYQEAIEQALQSHPWWHFKSIALWECYLVLNDQDNLNHCLRAHYLKMRPLLSELSIYYGYGRDLRVLGAHFVGHLHRVLENLERNQAAHQRSLASFRRCIVNSLGKPEASGSKYRLLKKPEQTPSGAAQFFHLIAHCNRPGLRAEG